MVTQKKTMSPSRKTHAQARLMARISAVGGYRSSGAVVTSASASACVTRAVPSEMSEGAVLRRLPRGRQSAVDD